ncbi:MAG: hypothetical protein ACRDY6_12045 [Acidimicrobiia bacterium]
MSPADVTRGHVFVDFSLVGGATRFRARLPARVRRKLNEGERIVVFGDTVDPLPAMVMHVEEDDANVVLELVES